ncbi:hypothetical protein HPB49_003182 [Dermacentor silvarum]|uniref:Uncharacterized protein n=1 Tax=Dermacentor silvarum TaxID=543639 RepID=A0ACB8DT60_DERSI|nr:hypothetical protein HPB49_003182 [Dermacentor silvarum]
MKDEEEPEDKHCVQPGEPARAPSTPFTLRANALLREPGNSLPGRQRAFGRERFTLRCYWLLQGYSPLAKGRLPLDRVVCRVALRQERLSAQVLKRCSLQKGVGALPKTTQPDRVRQKAQSRLRPMAMGPPLLCSQPVQRRKQTTSWAHLLWNRKSSWRPGDTGGNHHSTVVYAFRDCGYRHVDAPKRCGYQEYLGEAIAEIGVPCEEIFLATKLWPRDYQGTRGDGPLNAFRGSLQRLTVDYLDLYLMHWPECPTACVDWQRTLDDTWRQLELL